MMGIAKSKRQVGIVLVDSDVVIDWEMAWNKDKNSLGITLDVVHSYIFGMLGLDFRIWIPYYVEKELRKKGEKFLSYLYKLPQVQKCCLKNNEESIVFFGMGFTKGSRNFGELDALLQLKRMFEGDIWRLKKCKKHFTLKKPSLDIYFYFLTADKKFLSFLNKNKEQYGRIVEKVVLWNDVIRHNSLIRGIYAHRHRLL